MTALGGLPVYLDLDGLRDWGGRKRQLMANRHQLRRNTPPDTLPSRLLSAHPRQRPSPPLAKRIWSCCGACAEADRVGQRPSSVVVAAGAGTIHERAEQGQAVDFGHHWRLTGGRGLGNLSLPLRSGETASRLALDQVFQVRILAPQPVGPIV